MTSFVVLHEAFRSINAPYAIFGGAARALFDPTRVINDIDVITQEETIENISAELHTEAMTDEYGQRVVRSLKYEIYGTLRIRSEEAACIFTLDDSMLAHLMSARLEGVFIPVLSPEDNIVLKAILYRGGDKGKQDVEDVLFFRSMKPLELDYIRWRIDICAAKGRADLWLQNLGIL